MLGHCLTAQPSHQGRTLHTTYVFTLRVNDLTFMSGGGGNGGGAGDRRSSLRLPSAISYGKCVKFPAMLVAIKQVGNKT